MFDASAFSDLTFYERFLTSPKQSSISLTQLHAQLAALQVCHLLVPFCIRVSQVKSVGIPFGLKLFIIYNICSAYHRKKKEKGIYSLI